MPKTKRSAITEEKVKSKHIVINGMPLPEWLKLTEKERNIIRNKNR